MTLNAPCALAGTFRVPLTDFRQDDSVGEFLVADFDFGTAFSHVESVAFEFTMPGGFEGVVSNHSSRTLYVLLHDAAEPAGFEDIIPSTSNSLEAIRQGFTSIQPEIPTGFHFSTSLPCLTIGGEVVCPFAVVPDFVYAGRGRATVVEVLSASTTSYELPGEISTAYLTIVGTPVPEPSALILFGVAGGCLYAFRRWLRN